MNTTATEPKTPQPTAPTNKPLNAEALAYLSADPVFRQGVLNALLNAERLLAAKK